MDFKIITDNKIYEIANRDLNEILRSLAETINEIEIYSTAELFPNMFKSRLSLIKVVLHDVKELPYGIFRDCVNLREVDFGNSNVILREDCFSNCRKLGAVYNKDNIKFIEYNAFNNTRLINNNNKNVLLGKCLIKQEHLKPTLKLENYSEICSNCFANNDNIINLNVSSNVEYIQHHAFYNCTNLEFIKISSNTILDYNAFNNTLWESNENDFYTINGVLNYKENSDLRVIILPKETTIIPTGIFKGHSEITKVIFNTNLKEIKEDAFAQCGGITDIEINTNTKLKIHKNAFKECYRLKTVKINTSKTDYDKDAFNFSNCIERIQIDNRIMTKWF